MIQELKIEDILEKEGRLVSTTAGVSMYPMLRDRRDTVVISRASGRLKKYDVPLYRKGGRYVLHRIVRVLPDSYVICGDNCCQREYGITDDDVIGVLTGFYRGDRPVDMSGRGYRIYVRIWCFLYPARCVIKRVKYIMGCGWRWIRR